MEAAADARGFRAKALESLASAERDFEEGRYNSCANRCYYACFQAAVAALISEGIRPPAASGRWEHGFVQAQFVGVLIERRKMYPGTLRRVLGDTIDARVVADYQPEGVSSRRASRLVRAVRNFVATVGEGRSGNPLG